MDSNVEKEIKRLINLKNYKNYSDGDIYKVAFINIKIKEFNEIPLFTKPSEQEIAEKKFRHYLENYELESSSDLDTLRSLVYLEVFEYRIQQELNKLDGENKYPPEKLSTQLTTIQNQKLDLKVKLGIDAEKKEDDDLTKLQQLEKRFEKYYQENSHEFTVASGCCGKMLLFRKRVKDFDNLEHPWFAGRWLWNWEILKDVKEGKLSKEDAARYLGCSAEDKPSSFSKDYTIDYINWCLANWHKAIEYLEKK